MVHLDLNTGGECLTVDTLPPKNAACGMLVTLRLLGDSQQVALIQELRSNLGPVPPVR